MFFVIEDSGDPGIKDNSSNHLVLVVLILQNEKVAQQIANVIARFKQSFLPDAPEIKFYKMSRKLRVKFLQTINKSPFRVWAVIIEKSKFAKLESHAIYIKELLDRHRDELHSARIIIDGKLSRKDRQKARSILLRMNTKKTSNKIIKQIKFVDSTKDYLVQLADMMAGSLLRSTRVDKADRYLYQQLIKDKIDDIYRKRI